MSSLVTVETPAPAWRPRPVGLVPSDVPVAAQVPDRSVEDELALRMLRKEARIRAEAARPLDPWERHRAAAAGAEPSDYERAWREIRFDQLTSGLASQAHALARCNHEKYGALARLYAGLRLMAVMVAALVAFAALSAGVPWLRG